jgi:hypothetical protein
MLKDGAQVECSVTCNCCHYREHFCAPTGAQLDTLMEEHGWVRFGPCGIDLCFKCRGSSPNRIIQVRKEITP